MAAFTAFQLALIVGMLISGTINTVVKSSQNNCRFTHHTTHNSQIFMHFHVLTTWQAARHRLVLVLLRLVERLVDGCIHQSDGV